MMEEYSFLNAKTSAQILTALFLAILFLQSGLDKVFNWAGNLDWLKGYFSKSLLKDVVPLLLAIITLTEILAGALSAIGLVYFLMTGNSMYVLWGAQLSALSIVMLFFGQRMAKDYAGAASLVSYFIVTIMAILLFAM